MCVELTLGKRGTEIWLSSGSSYWSVLLNETSHNKKRSRHHMLTDKECIFLCIYVDQIHVCMYAFIHSSLVMLMPSTRENFNFWCHLFFSFFKISNSIHLTNFCNESSFQVGVVRRVHVSYHKKLCYIMQMCLYLHMP